MVLVVLLFQEEQTRSEDLQPGVDGYSASLKLLSIHPMGAYTSSSFLLVLLVLPSAQPCSLRCLMSRSEVRIAVTMAGARRKVETYIRIQVLGPDRVQVISIVEECGKIIK